MWIYNCITDIQRHKLSRSESIRAWLLLTPWRIMEAPPGDIFVFLLTALISAPLRNWMDNPRRLAFTSSSLDSLTFFLNTNISYLLVYILIHKLKYVQTPALDRMTWMGETLHCRISVAIFSIIFQGCSVSSDASHIWVGIISRIGECG